MSIAISGKLISPIHTVQNEKTDRDGRIHQVLIFGNQPVPRYWEEEKHKLLPCLLASCHALPAIPRAEQLVAPKQKMQEDKLNEDRRKFKNFSFHYFASAFFFPTWRTVVGRYWSLFIYLFPSYRTLLPYLVFLLPPSHLPPLLSEKYSSSVVGLPSLLPALLSVPNNKGK